MSQSDFAARVRQHFDRVASELLSQLVAGEAATLNISAEDTLFVRFNGNRVRQNTDVQQINMALQLQSAGRSVEQSRTLSGEYATDWAAMVRLLQDCRQEILVLPPDPHQVPIENNGTSAEEFAGALLAPQDIVSAVVGPAQACDLAGLYAGGTVIRGNRNSRGQRHWFATESFFLDYSLYNGNQAAKGSYAGARWEQSEWVANLGRTQRALQLLKQPRQAVRPGQYRTYLAPRAFADLLGMLSWNALSAAAWKQGRSPFKKLADHEARLSPLLSMGRGSLKRPAVPVPASCAMAGPPG